MPLCLGIKPPTTSVKELIKHHFDFLVNHESGVPVSLVDSAQQWDYPNGNSN